MKFREKTVTFQLTRTKTINNNCIP